MRNILLLLLLVAASAAKTVETPTVYVVASSEKVRNAASGRMLGQGFKIESDTERQIVFFREEHGGAGIFAQAVAGNTSCPMPRRMVTLSIVKDEDRGVNVYGTDEIEIAKAYCRRDRHPLNDKRHIADMKNLLDNIKRDAER